MLLSCPDGLNSISVTVTLFIYFVVCSFEKSQTKHIKFHVGKKIYIFSVVPLLVKSVSGSFWAEERKQKMRVKMYTPSWPV